MSLYTVEVYRTRPGETKPYPVGTYLYHVVPRLGDTTNVNGLHQRVTRCHIDPCTEHREVGRIVLFVEDIC